MIQITPQMRILLAVEPVDFKKGIDGLAMLCRTVLKADPFAGYLFVFLNRSKTSIKIVFIKKSIKGMFSFVFVFFHLWKF